LCQVLSKTACEKKSHPNGENDTEIDEESFNGFTQSMVRDIEIIWFTEPVIFDFFIKSCLENFHHGPEKRVCNENKGSPGLIVTNETALGNVYYEQHIVVSSGIIAMLSF